MPKDIREHHRFLEIGEEIEDATKIIIGSFSVYNLTNHLSSNIEKYENNIHGFDFFYGSRRNQLWNWYKCHIDNDIILGDRNSIISSLKINFTAITDVVKSCERKGYSALDKALFSFEWNRKGIIRLINSGATNILCTSKWVLQKLEREIVMKEGFVLDVMGTEELEQAIFHSIQIYTRPRLSIAKVYVLDNVKLSVISIPSPGGNTFRRLDLYGYDKRFCLSAGEFLSRYLRSSFTYFFNKTM